MTTQLGSSVQVGNAVVTIPRRCTDSNLGTTLEAAFRNMRTWLGTALVLVVLGFVAPAWALQQPGGATIPSEMGCDGGNPTGLAATFACVCDGGGGTCNIGAACPGNADPNSCDDGA